MGDEFGEQFAEEIRRVVDERYGGNVFALEKRVGLPIDAIRSVIRKDSKRANPKVTRAKEICDALGLEFYIGPPRETSPVPVVELDGEDYAAIPRFDVELAAGAGRINEEGAPVEHLAFSRAWLRRMGVPADRAVLLKLRGNSMQPTLHDGDLVLIDRSRQIVRDRRIHAFAEPGGEARVKRLERAGDQLLIRSDNPDCPTEIRNREEAARIEIIGEVVWSGHVFK